MDESKYYRVYSKYLMDRYKEKVYKLPISIDLTCPNRDGNLGFGGCIFCGEEGGSFENLSKDYKIKEQLEKNKAHISKKYKAKKFIAFFQNFTNTYIGIEEFKKMIYESLIDDIVGISISTRPDCISDEYLEFLKSVSDKNNIDINIELGLQSVNYHTLKRLNRGHGLAEFIDAMIRIKKYNFSVCVHMILNLPWDDIQDIEEGARIISALDVQEVKLHSLYIVKNTEMGRMYENDEFEMISKDEYIERVILFLENLSPDIVIQRLIGRAPEENTLFVNWNTSWWKIKDQILKRMEERGSYQGKKYNYLNGKALKRMEV
ncbi:MAG: TIGR01212 family radical SAM protein [Andreesenia angusta]|nr:TIGR01212 family radical SAM protein [Andreesenia angusta]